MLFPQARHLSLSPGPWPGCKGSKLSLCRVLSHSPSQKNPHCTHSLRCTLLKLETIHIYFFLLLLIFLAELGFELGTSDFLGKCSPSATPPTLFGVEHFQLVTFAPGAELAVGSEKVEFSWLRLFQSLGPKAVTSFLPAALDPSGLGTGGTSGLWAQLGGRFLSPADSGGRPRCPPNRGPVKEIACAVVRNVT
jgi:hypothetical protein